MAGWLAPVLKGVLGSVVGGGGGGGEDTYQPSQANQIRPDMGSQAVGNTSQPVVSSEPAGTTTMTGGGQAPATQGKGTDYWGMVLRGMQSGGGRSSATPTPPPTSYSVGTPMRSGPVVSSPYQPSYRPDSYRMR